MDAMFETTEIINITIPVTTPIVNPICNTLVINEHRIRPKAAIAPPTNTTIRCPNSLLRVPARGPGQKTRTQNE